MLMRNGRDRRLGEPVLCHATTDKRVLLIGTRSADYIRASSQSDCIDRPHTWLHPNASLNVRFLLQRGRRPYMACTTAESRPSASTEIAVPSRRGGTAARKPRRCLQPAGRHQTWQPSANQTDPWGRFEHPAQPAPNPILAARALAGSITKDGNAPTEAPLAPPVLQVPSISAEVSTMAAATPRTPATAGARCPRRP
jgi:hypothetical protein